MITQFSSVLLVGFQENGGGIHRRKSFRMGNRKKDMMMTSFFLGGGGGRVGTEKEMKREGLMEVWKVKEVVCQRERERERSTICGSSPRIPLEEQKRLPLPGTQYNKTWGWYLVQL